VARLVKKVYALDVSKEITTSVTGTQNIELVLFDGCNIPLPANSVKVATSIHVMEHIHPYDALEQLKDIHRILVDHGMYICVTPNRLSGPHDISMFFDEVPSGFHLKEYTNTELSNFFKQAGFSTVRTYGAVRGIYFNIPFFLIRFLESLLGGLPRPLRKVIARLPLIKSPLSDIRMVGTK
jgi:SAM-dependent methyltransferase